MTDTGFRLDAGWVVTPGDDGGVEVLADVSVAVRGSRIEYVGPEAGLPEPLRGLERVDAREAVVIPGFVNTHNHAAMTLLRGYADDMPLMQWLNEKIWPAEAHLTGEDVYWGTLAAAAEQIRSGVTAFADMYFFMEDAARAVEESGMRAQLSRGLVGVAPGSDRSLAEGVDLFQRWDGRDDGRITVALAPHAPYTCPDGFVREVLAEARRLEAPIHTHLAETRDEIEQLAAERNLSPIQWAVEVGLVERPVLAAHCVHVTPADIDLMSRHGIAASHNPISNLKLASGIAPVADMLERGVLVGLGTDGACSTNHLNFFEEMRSAAWVQKVARMDAAVLGAAQVFRMATVDGARALGYPDLGRIREGFRADLVVLDARAAHMAPRHDLLSLVVYSAQTVDVRDVWIHGRPVLRDRRILTFDEARAVAECDRRGRRLAERAGAA
ncbi:MAG TPA: amidohydrolase [Bacillota bacterium]